MNDINGARGGFLRGSLSSRQRTRGGTVSGPSSAQTVAVRPESTGEQPNDYMTAGKPPVSGGSKKMKILFVTGGALIIVFAGLAGFFFWQYKSSAGDDEAAISQRIIEQVNDVYLLPEGEEPTVAEIRDKEKLKDQSFFDAAQTGDHLLVYSEAKIALIYRESAGKLVNVGPISTSADAAAGEEIGESTGPPGSSEGSGGAR